MEYLFALEKNHKITYTCDKSFGKDHFAMEIKDCDLLIHEATFDDDFADEALSQNRSTISQANKTYV
jgi:ribonuclease BN (tRNA processing enzyme)